MTEHVIKRGRGRHRRLRRRRLRLFGWGRSEAYADLIAQAPPAVAPAARTRRRAGGARLARALVLAPARVRHGRPLRLALRVLAGVVLALAALRSGAGTRAAGGVVAGLVVWFVLTVRADLAPPPGR